MKNYLITTKHRGVWFAQIEEGKDITSETLTDLYNCRMAIKWGTEDGLQQLCNTGPTERTKMSSVSDIAVLHHVTAVFNVTDKAALKWLK